MDTRNLPSVSTALAFKFWKGWAACDFIDMVRTLDMVTTCCKYRGQDDLDDVTFVFVSGRDVKEADKVYRDYRFSERGMPDNVNCFIDEDLSPARFKLLPEGFWPRDAFGNVAPSIKN